MTIYQTDAAINNLNVRCLREKGIRTVRLSKMGSNLYTSSARAIRVPHLPEGTYSRITLLRKTAYINYIHLQLHGMEPHCVALGKMN